jgi:hypothetical protein
LASSTSRTSSACGAPTRCGSDEQNLERLRSADTLLLGATTYTGLKGYWPAVAETSEVSITVIANPDVADLLREIGRRNNEIRKVVVSDSVTEDGTAPRTRTTTILRRARMRDRPLPSSRTSRARTSSCSRAGRSGTNCWPPGSSTSCT